MQQDLLGGKKRARPKFGAAFRRGRKHDSSAEDRIAGLLAGRGLKFSAHVRIIPPRLEKRFRMAEAEKLATISASCKKDLAALLKRFPLEKIHPEKFRTDFLVEGFVGARRERIFIEYLGLWNLAAKMDARSLRRRHSRAIALYTFIKVPLKLEIYRRAGAGTILIYPGEDPEKKLAALDGLSQKKSTLSGWLSS